MIGQVDELWWNSLTSPLLHSLTRLSKIIWHMKPNQDAEKLARVLEVYDQAQASMDNVLQSDASDAKKVEQLNEIVQRADKEVETILHAQKKDPSVK